MANWYTKGVHEIANAVTDYANAGTSIQVALVTSTYSFSKAHDFANDITNEVTGGGYARAVLGTKVVTNNTGSNRSEYDAADSTYTNITGTNVAAAIIFRSTGTNSTSPLLWYVNFTATSPSAANVTLQWGSTGFAHITN